MGGSLEALPPSRWDPVSFTPDRVQPGKKLGKVTAHGVGIKDGGAWSFWTFKRDDDQTVHTVWGIQDVTGKEHIMVAKGEHNHDNMGGEKANGRIAMKPVIQGFSVKTALELLYDEAGKTAIYRFDGRNFP